MKKILMMITAVLSGTLLSLAQRAVDSTSTSIDHTTSGYSNRGAIGLVILILIVVIIIMGFTWRKKKVE